MIKLKRVYEDADPDDGRRYLVDRLWPRGLRKERAAVDVWLKDVAPSTELRRWFGHDPQKWKGFCRRYFSELERNHPVWRPLLEESRHGTVTLLFSAQDVSHNNAVALKDYLESRRLKGL